MSTVLGWHPSLDVIADKNINADESSKRENKNDIWHIQKLFQQKETSINGERQ